MPGDPGVALSPQWKTTWSDLRLTPPADIFAQLVARYSEPHRAYHTPQHLVECFEWFEQARALAPDPGAVQLALWFHDAVYDTNSRSNEDDSALWATEVLAAAGAPAGLGARVRSLILATKHDAAPVEPDARLTVDVDLSILGAPVARFDEYESQIRKEYAWVPEPLYVSERAKILRSFLARRAIYGTPFFGSALEARARANLERSVARLHQPGERP